MAEMKDLKGFCYPLTPKGDASLLGDFPWHYGTEYLNIAYRLDPARLEAWLPRPLGLSKKNPDRAYVAFSKWWSVWEGRPDMPYVNPERTQYKEAAIWANCSYEGMEGQICLLIWVDNDFSMARGWFMGFPKKLGQVFITDYNELNPKMAKVGVGSKLKGIVGSHGERLIEGGICVERKIAREELPKPMGLPLLHIRHFPSIVAGEKPSVCELVKLGSQDWRYDADIWAGKGELKFFPSEIEEHMDLAPEEVLGAYRFRNGYTFAGAERLYSWV
jgi:Acetoacetate decarboxylase